MAPSKQGRKAAKVAATPAAEDRGEALALMEPMLVAEGSRLRRELTDLTVELAARAAGFRRSLPLGVVAALGGLVRSMNCYYSNLIEGHNTHPIDIERALRDDYSADRDKRDLQLEARAHIDVQAWIDGGGLPGRATDAAAIRQLHERFCALLPEALLRVEPPETSGPLTVVPGAYRTLDVKVGRHVAISPGAVPRFMKRFEQAYAAQGRTDQILCVAPAHHRLLWIHPFTDGNGRVARLMSHAMLLDCLDTGGIWSIARGLARSEAQYKAHLAACDLERRNDLDGRGTRSEEALAAFTRYFLEVCIDQVRFMEALVEPNRLRQRILRWVSEESQTADLPAKAGLLLEAILYRGEVPRADVSGLLDYSTRQARRVVAALLEREVISSASPRAPLRLNFPARLAHAWMPGLFPEPPI